MKNIIATCIWLLFLCCHTMTAQNNEIRFPEGYTFYFTDKQRVKTAKIMCYYDKENAPVCEVFTGDGNFIFGLWVCNTDGFLSFHGFKHSPETKLTYTIYSPMPIITYTGKIVKEQNANRILLSSDYQRVIINETNYNVRITKKTYDEMMNAVHQNNKSSFYPGTVNSRTGSGNYNSDNKSRQQSTICKYCHGTGNCSSCKGKGYKFNPYSGKDEACPSCRGNARCFNCFGSGRQR